MMAADGQLACRQISVIDYPQWAPRSVERQRIASVFNLQQIVRYEIDLNSAA